MVAIETAIAKVFIDVAVSTGVDVLSQRASNPLVRGAARAHKVYTLISSVEGAYNAIRLSAYSDATQLIGQEAVIEAASKEIARALLRISEANYEVHRRAEKYLLTPEYAEADRKDHPLCGWVYGDSGFGAKDVHEFGRPLANQTAICVARAVRAREIATELTSYPEARKPRGSRNWDRKPIWIDRINSSIGNLLWQPAPEIGLGMRPVANFIYSGIFRRDVPEGYGSVELGNGSRFYGQTRHGFPSGYGVWHFADGSMYFGRIGLNSQLGASISPKRDWVHYGEHDGSTAHGYGRRVGIASGLNSYSGIWTRGEATHPFKSSEDIHRNIASGMNQPVLSGLKREYERTADDARREIEQSDRSVMSYLGGYL